MGDYIDIVFAKSPDPNPDFRFVEVEDPNGASVDVGNWLQREDGRWVLRIGAPVLRADSVPPNFVSKWTAAIKDLPMGENMLLEPAAADADQLTDEHRESLETAIRVMKDAGFSHTVKGLESLLRAAFAKEQS
jgi:hypothetical protein